MRRDEPKRRRELRSGATISIAAAIALLALAAGALAATGDLGPKGCIDDKDTGPDTCFKTEDGLAGARAVAVSPDGSSVYVASALDDAIVRFDRNTATGELTPRGCVQDNDTGTDDCAQSADGLGLPFSIAVSPDGESVYAASRGDDAVVHLDRNPNTGSLTPEGCVQDDDTGTDGCADSADGLDDVNGVAVSPDGESVYASSISDDAVVRFSRNLSSGNLTAKDCVEDNDTGSGECAESTDGLDGAFSVAVTADGTTVYVAALDDSAIVHFRRNVSSGKLIPKDCLDDAAGPENCDDSTDGLSGAFGVAVSPDNKSVYATAINSNAVVRFKRNTTNGVLILRGCIQDDAGPGPCEESADGLNAPTSVTVSPDGESVYVGGTGDDAVVRFNRNTTSGALTPKGCVDDDFGLDNCAQTTDGLDGAAGVAVSPDGASLYAVSVVDEAIVRFARDPG